MNDRQLRSLRPRKTILSEDVRRGLHERGYSLVRQSGLATYRECPAKLRYQIVGETPHWWIQLLLGSVLHKAFSLGKDCAEYGNDSEWWESLFELVRAEEKAKGNAPVYSYQGMKVDWKLILQLCHKFTSQDALGSLTLAQVVTRTLERLNAKGFTILDNEVKLDHVDGDTYPVTFEGTLDFRVTSRAGMGILDLKSPGLWNAYLKDVSANKETFDNDDITYHPQLRHYHWLHKLRYPTMGVAYYGLVIPTNLVPYKKSGSWGPAGTPKGDCLFLAPAIDDAYVRDYQHQVRLWLTQISQGIFYKSLPTLMGKQRCSDCPYFGPCLKNDTSAARVAELASRPELAYLHEKE